MDLAEDADTGLGLPAPMLPPHDTADLRHFCAAEALSRLIFFSLTLSVLAKRQGPQSHLLGGPVQPV